MREEAFGKYSEGEVDSWVPAFNNVNRLVLVLNVSHVNLSATRQFSYCLTQATALPYHNGSVYWEKGSSSLYVSNYVQ